MQKTFKRVLAVVLALVLTLSVFTISVSAAVENYNPDYESTTHSVFKHTEQTLAPGVTQYTNYAYTKADGKQMVYYVTTADVNREDVMLQVSYKGMQHETYGMEKLTQTVATANAKYSDSSNPEFISENYSVVSATNGNGYNMKTGQPTGVWAMGGEVIQEYTGSTAFFAILKDGRAVMGKTKAEWNAYKADPGIQEAINAFGSTLVWDGVPSVNATGSYYTDRASRTMLGVTEDGKVILIVVDGRQEPFSCGASMAELAQIMMEAGAKYAINLDGGGSTTYMAKNEGSDDCVILNRPSDGSERAISNGLIIASLAAPSDSFDHAVISVDNDYVMPGASVNFTATGVSPTGTSADIPEGVTFTAENGTVNNGVYTAGAAGVDTISMIYNDKVVGTCNVNVVVPDSIEFKTASIACPYGKTTDLGVVPMYGVHEVAFGADNVTFTLGNNSFGTINASDMTFTATTDTLSTTTTTITVATNCDPSVSATINLQVGKGSEVIWDFEDQSTENMSLFDYYNSGVRGSLEIVNDETGKVRNGDYALAINYDFSQLTYYEDYIDLMFCYNAEKMKAHGNTKDADGVVMGGDPSDFINITGATGIGMWMYIPDEVDAKGLNPRFFFGFKKTATSAWTRGTSGMKLLVDVQHLPTDNWYYYYADLSAYSSYAGLTLQASRSLASNGTTKNGQKGYPTNYYAGPCFEFYVEDSAWKSYQNKSYNSKFTLFIDDYTVDYSTVVADREAPEFGDAVYATTGMWQAETFTDGITMNKNDIDITINVADATRKLAGGVTAYTPTTNATGINPSSAKAYVDGNAVPCTYKNGKIAIDTALVLADGPHTVKFTVEDNNGNLGYKNLNFNVATEIGYDTIVVKPHDETLTETPVGSLYYIDLVATDISKINKASATLKVNNVNDWEAQGAVVADGFSLDYTTEPGDAGELTVTINRTGEVTESGEAVLASIPIRAWYPHNDLGKDSNWIITYKNCVYPMDIQMVTKEGSIEFTDDTEHIGAFSADKIQIDSEAMCEYGYIGAQKGNEDGTIDVTSWHEHSAHAVADKAATCTEDGYTGRTFCDDCNSVVDWGTVVPATGHNYEFVEGVLKCANCNELFNGKYTDGKLYVDGVPAGGVVDGILYEDGVPYTGYKEVDGTYRNYEDGVDKGAYTGLVEKDGKLYFAQIGVLATGWKYIDEKYYYFEEDSKAAYADTTVAINAADELYTFDENGVLIAGSFTERDGHTVYHWAGDRVKRQFFEIDGETYYFDFRGWMVTGFVGIEKGSNAHENNYYVFDENGKQVKQTGLTFACDGTVCFLGDDYTAQYVGMIQDGEDYYYINSSLKAVKDCEYLCLKTNGLMPADKYAFDEDGKMIKASVKNGVEEENGVLYLYKNGEKLINAHLVEFNGDYYYVRSSGQLATGDYLVWSGNGIVPDMTTHHFDSDGKMNDPVVEPKNGVVEENGVLYLYKNGEKLINAHIVEYNGAYYYVRSSGQLAIGDYLVWSGNGIVPDMTIHHFDSDGKMNDPVVEPFSGIKEEDGSLYLYIDDVKQINKGLVEFDGAYYYVRSGGQLATGDYLVWSGNGIVPDKTTHHFELDGKMNDPTVEPFTGIKEEEGSLYLYIDDVKQINKGLVEYEGAYYYVRSGGQLATGDYLVWSGNGIVPDMTTHHFEADGKMNDSAE